MVCSSYSRREADILWRSLVGVTFLFCSLIVYRFIAFDNVQCLSNSDCSKSLKHTAEKYQSENCNTVCITKDCVDISYSMLRTMNQTADPCSDFYNFACGNFVDKYGVDDNYTAFDLVGEDLHKTLKDFIETSNEPNGTMMHKIKVIYDSCVNKGTSEINAMHDIMSFLGNIGLHNWPYLSSNFSFVNQDLPELLGKLNSYNQDVFFRFESSNFGKSNKKIMKKLYELLDLIKGFPNIRDRIKLEIEPVFKNKNRDLNKFEKSLKNILRYLGLQPDIINMMWEEFVTIDKSMNKLMKDPDVFESRDGLETIECRKEKEEFKIMLCKTLDSVVRNGKIASRVYRNQMQVSKSTLHFVENVYGLIKNISDRTIANHIALNVILNNLDYMNFFIRKSMKIDLDQLEDAEYSYMRYFEKWRYCVVWMAERLPYALAAEYLDKLFPNEAEDEVNYMIEEVINTTIGLIQKQEGIEEHSKIEAAEMIQKQKDTFSGNAKILKNKKKMNLSHKTFIPTPTSFIHNVFLLNKFLFTSTLLKEDIFSHFEQWKPFFVNAQGGIYLHIPLGVLRPPMFKYGYPKIANIATLGSVIGHEIGHTLDLIHEDYEHNISSTPKIFQKRYPCLIQQYSKFELKDIKKYVRGNQTISENFPDHLGLEVAEKISENYIMELTKNGFSLPGMRYSPAELFYIRYAQLWCTHDSPGYQLYLNEMDPHVPNDFQIIGTLQNSPRFSRVFNCPKTSYMNPEKKCRVFD